MADYSNYNWGVRSDNPNNLIPRTLELHSKLKRFFIPEGQAPEGMPVVEIEYDNGNKGRGVVLDGTVGLSLIFVTLFRNGRLAPMRFRKTKYKGAEKPRPFMYVPVLFEGATELYKLAVNGQMIHEINKTIDEFNRKIVDPHAHANPGAGREIFQFAVPIVLNRREKAGDSFIYAPDLNFTGSYTDYALDSDVVADVEKFLELDGLPFIQAQEEARLKEAREKFGSGGHQAVPPITQNEGQGADVPF